MTRERTKARKAKAGIKVPSFKSRTSPSYYKSRDRYRKEKTIGKPYYRRHVKRTELKIRLIKELGLPLNTIFIFRHSDKDRKDLADRESLVIEFGTVVVINKRDLSIVLIVRCIPFDAMDTQLRESYNHSISLTFQHARARNRCKIHCSIQDRVGEDHEKEDLGWMGCCGWRGGCEKGKSAGGYSMSAFTSANIGRILTDKERMEEFHKIRDFWAERFSSLSLFVFKSNLALAFQAAIPGFDALAWQLTPNGTVFASNLVITCDGFHNYPHTDKDHTRYSFGMWGLIIRNSGQPYDKEVGVTIGGKSGVKLGDVKGSRFRVDEFGIEVALGICNGVYDILWDSKIEHYTTPSIAYNAQGKQIPHKRSPITLYGSSCQISESLVQRIKLLGEKKEGMSDLDWENYCKIRIKGYDEEFTKKLSKAEEKELLRIEEQQRKRELAANIKFSL